MKSFRGLRYFLAPPWLTGRGDGEKVAFTLEWILDSFLEKLRQGLNARFPRRAGESAINLIIGDRGLLRGRDESLADLAARLIAWRTPRTHRVRGNGYEVVRQVWQYWQSWNPGYADVFDAHFVTHSKQSDGTESRDDFGTWDWDGSDPDVHWSRFWVTISNDGIEEHPDLGDAELWGGALGTPGYTLGQLNVRPEDVTAMRALFQELKWAPAHAVPEWAIVTSNDIGGGSFPAADATWKYWSKNSSGTRVRSRSLAYKYWSLDPLRNNTYGGDRTRPWPAAATQVDGTGTYTGDRSNASAWDEITLPSGRTYQGVRRFPARVLLVDDGSVPA